MFNPFVVVVGDSGDPLKRTIPPPPQLQLPVTWYRERRPPQSALPLAAVTFLGQLAELSLYFAQVALHSAHLTLQCLHSRRQACRWCPGGRCTGGHMGSGPGCWAASGWGSGMRRWGKGGTWTELVVACCPVTIGTWCRSELGVDERDDAHSLANARCATRRSSRAIVVVLQG